MKHKHKGKLIILIGAICCLGLTWLFTGGVVFRKIEGYHFETRRVSDNELIYCYLQGKVNRDIYIPFFLRYIKSLRPFELVFQSFYFLLFIKFLLAKRLAGLELVVFHRDGKEPPAFPAPVWPLVA